MNVVSELQLPSRYVPINCAGEGGFGTVFSVQDLNLERDVAIKVIQDFSELQRLRDEIDALLKLRSKHVVQVFDITPGNNGHFGIVMEFISGQDLCELDLANLSFLERLKLLWQISCGIDDIHDAGLIHRDIKPNNMKVDAEGILKIFDFGLARHSTVNAETQGFKGTFGFAAPEQFSNGFVSFTNAIDVYAFGVVALYILTQRVPARLCNIPPSPLVNAFGNVVELQPFTELTKVLEQCLSHNISTRPSIKTVKRELSKTLLFNKHQAVTVINNNTKLLNANSPRVNLQLSGIGSFEIHYNGYEFWIKNASGEVFMNNRLVSSDKILPGSCVVALGNSRRNWSERAYVTFDLSNPEVSV